MDFQGVNQTPSQPPKKRPFFKLSVVSLVVILLVVSFLFGYLVAFSQVPRPQPVNFLSLEAFRQSSQTKGQEFNLDFDLFWSIWDRLHTDYVNRTQLDDQALFYGAIRGLVEAAGDPYTVFFDPQETEQFNDELSGTFDGIGAEISIKENRLTIVAPLPDSPAEKAGLQAGDIILAINDEDVSHLSLDAAISKIRGPRGSQVKLTVIHNSDGGQAEDVTITRDRIDVPTVKWEMDDQRIAYIQVVSFSEDVEKKFVKALTEVIKANPVGLIIDLRNNPGGYLTASVDIASAWVPENQVVVREIFTDASKNNEYRAKKQLAAPKVPTIVLLNQGSASASEILAGALQDYQLATIVGETSFGKGSVQNYEDLTGGSSLKLTVAKWLTPKGRSIDDLGIAPDIEVPLTAEDIQADKDPQLDKAKELILGKY